MSYPRGGGDGKEGERGRKWRRRRRRRRKGALFGYLPSFLPFPEKIRRRLGEVSRLLNWEEKKRKTKTELPQISTAYVGRKSATFTI